MRGDPGSLEAFDNVAPPGPRLADIGPLAPLPSTGRPSGLDSPGHSALPHFRYVGGLPSRSPDLHYAWRFTSRTGRHIRDPHVRERDLSKRCDRHGSRSRRRGLDDRIRHRLGDIPAARRDGGPVRTDGQGRRVTVAADARRLEGRPLPGQRSARSSGLPRCDGQLREGHGQPQPGAGPATPVARTVRILPAAHRALRPHPRRRSDRCRLDPGPLGRRAARHRHHHPGQRPLLDAGAQRPYRAADLHPAQCR